MGDIVFNTAVTLTKRELVKYGVGCCVEASLNQLNRSIEDKFVDLILSDLKDGDNNFQFVLTINKL